MMTYFLLILISSVLYAQVDTIQVLSLMDTKAVNTFEIAFIKKIEAVHNTSESKRIHLVIQKIDSYKELFNRLSDNRIQNLAAINSISITKERLNQYSFSYPYMPVKQLLVSSKNRKDFLRNWRDNKNILAVNPNTKHLKESIQLQKKYGFKLIYFHHEDNPSFLAERAQFDFYLTDSAELWENQNLYAIDDFTGGENSAFAILFQRNSPVAKTINHTIKNYVNSNEYEQLILQYLGAGPLQFFRQNKYLLNIKNF